MPAVTARTIQSERFVWLFGALAVVIVAYWAAWALGLGDHALLGRYTGAFAFPIGLLAAGLMIRLRRCSWLDQGTRQCWTAFLLAMAIYLAGALCNLAGTADGSLSFLTSVSPWLEVSAYGLATFGFVLLPMVWRSKYDSVVFALNISIVAWSATMLLWHFLVYPIGQTAEPAADLFTMAGASIYMVCDLSFAFTAAALLMKGLRPSSQRAVCAIMAALLFAFVGDVIAGTDALRHQYTPGGTSGALYSFTWLAIALAAWLQSRPDDGLRRSHENVTRFPFGWLPYVAIVVAFLAPAALGWSDLGMLRQHIPATGLLIALVACRLWVTARQKASLTNAERERLATAVDQAAEAILMTDANGTISYVNPAFSRITGFTAEEAEGRSATFLTDGDSGDRLAEIRRVVAGGTAWGGRLQYRHKEGTAVEVDLVVSPLRDGSGSVVGSVEVARDVSRETELESQLAEAQRMEAIGRLAGGIAHDFNNILTVISGFAELAVDEVPTDHPVAEDLAQILEASERAAALTQSLLAYSRRQVLMPSVLDLNEFVADISPMLARLIGEDVTLETRADPELWPALADRGHLEQVVMNLAANARDAMPAGGKLVIETANEILDDSYTRCHVGANPGPHVMLAVVDTGVGMTPEVIKHAFDPFFTTKTRGKGPGLGLSTVLGIVSQSHGSIDIQTEPGHGTAVRVYLPRAVTPAAETPSDTNPHVPTAGRSILVVEDEPAVRSFVGKVLSHAGYLVSTAATGEEALKIAPTIDRLDLLFTDMVMPGMGGLELIRTLTADRPEVRVICASGYTDEAIFKGGAGETLPPYLSKPFTAEALLALVRTVLDGAT